MKRLTMVLLASFALFSLHFADGTRAASVTIELNEYPFPTSLTGYVNGDSVSYNLLNDVTATVLTLNNGDLNDFFVSFFDNASPPPPLAASGRPNVEWQTFSSGRYTVNNGYVTPVSSNNTGTVSFAGVKITFGSQFIVDDLTATFTSLNTAGVSWESSTIGLLKPDGSFFSPQPTIAPYLSHTSINGNAGLGWFMADSKGTVLDVGTNLTKAGSNGSNDNATLGYSEFGLLSGTPIGGLYWVTQLEDVRGLNNGNTNFTASLARLSLNVTPIPEPSSVLALGLMALCHLAVRRRSRTFKSLLRP